MGRMNYNSRIPLTESFIDCKSSTYLLVSCLASPCLLDAMAMYPGGGGYPPPQGGGYSGGYGGYGAGNMKMQMKMQKNQAKMQKKMGKQQMKMGKYSGMTPAPCILLKIYSLFPLLLHSHQLSWQRASGFMLM